MRRLSAAQGAGRYAFLPQAALILLAVVMAGCATTPRAPRTVLPPEQQQQALQALERFDLDGRVSISTTGDIASLGWRQRGPETSLRLAGPLGAGALQVTWRPGNLRLASRGDVFEGEEAEAILLRELGFLPPFEAMRYWVLGIEAPGEAPTSRTDTEDGRIGELQQAGWHIRYDRWGDVAATAGGVRMARRMVIARDELRLTVFVDKWKL